MHILIHSVKSVHTRSYSGLYFSTFELNNFEYGLFLRNYCLNLQKQCLKLFLILGVLKILQISKKDTCIGVSF